ncbi:MAG: orotidine-5'-phosphate decarboxylase [Candidatus Neomarinimicrobiota bacterium]|nr:orotidine-5'-phosphate decarboxylase [Candidatus Neomarinimicrobiota bacterium]
MKSFSERLLQATVDFDSILCVGLDIDADRIDPESPPSLDEMKSFTKSVIEATLDHVCAFKLNLAFFESYGSKGFAWLEETLDFIGGRRLTIGDGKRSDIDNTAKKYAAAMFDHFGFDAVTLSPYMGPDSLSPFLDRPDRGAFVLCLTSNPGSREIQLWEASGVAVYRKVISMVRDLNENNNCGLVIGATKSEQMADIRLEAGRIPFLVPGIGAQGGDLEASVSACTGDGIGLINVSRAVLYTSDPAHAALDYNSRINSIIKNASSF